MTDPLSNMSDMSDTYLRELRQDLETAHHQLVDQQNRYILESPSPGSAWMSEEYKRLQTAMEEYNEQIAGIREELRRRGNS